MCQRDQRHVHKLVRVSVFFFLLNKGIELRHVQRLFSVLWTCPNSIPFWVWREKEAKACEKSHGITFRIPNHQNSTPSSRVKIHLFKTCWGLSFYGYSPSREQMVTEKMLFAAQLGCHLSPDWDASFPSGKNRCLTRRKTLKRGSARPKTHFRAGRTCLLWPFSHKEIQENNLTNPQSISIFK